MQLLIGCIRPAIVNKPDRECQYRIMKNYFLLMSVFVCAFFLFSCTEEQQPVNDDLINSDESGTDSSIQYYIAQTGDDVNGNGSSSQPWLSLSHAIQTMPVMQDSVTLNVGAGTYVLDGPVVIANQRRASDAGRLVIRGAADETVTLDGRLIADFGAMISIRNSDYVTITNLELTNLVGNKSGIHVTGDSSNITISNNKIHGMHWTTDATLANTPQPVDNLNPIAIVGDSQDPMKDVSILNNKMYNLTTGYSEALKLAGNLDGFLVAGNEVYDVSNIGIVAAGNYAWVGLQDASLNQARNGVIRDNEVYRCVSPVAASAGIYVDGGRDITVTKNHSHHNTVGFSVGSEQPGEASRVVLSDNISTDNTQAGLVIGTISPNSMVTGVTVTGNEFDRNYTNPVWGGAPIVINKSNNVSIESNSIGSISQYMVTVNAASDNLILNNNSYKSDAATASDAVFSWLGISNQNYTGFDTYRSATGQDARSTFGTGQDGMFASLVNSFKRMFSK